MSSPLYAFPGSIRLSHCLLKQLSSIECFNNKVVIDEIVTRTSKTFAHRNTDGMTLEGDVATVIRMTDPRGNSDQSMEQIEGRLMHAVQRCSCSNQDESLLGKINYYGQSRLNKLYQ